MFETAFSTSIKKAWDLWFLMEEWGLFPHGELQMLVIIYFEGYEPFQFILVAHCPITELLVCVFIQAQSRLWGINSVQQYPEYAGPKWRDDRAN